MEIPILRGPARDEPLMIEICRSFSYKLNCANHGGPAYESMDFFASRKLMVEYGDRDAMSEQLYQECQDEVKQAVARAIAIMADKAERKNARRAS